MAKVTATQVLRALEKDPALLEEVTTQILMRKGLDEVSRLLEILHSQHPEGTLHINLRADSLTLHYPQAYDSNEDFR